MSTKEMSWREIFEGVRDKVGDENLNSSCSRDGCQVHLTDIPPQRIIVDLDRAFQGNRIQGSRCDFIIFLFIESRQTIAIIPIELKSGHIGASTVSKQLTAGANFAEKFVPRSVTFICRPVLFHAKRIHTVEFKKLNSAKVDFHGRSTTISTAHCDRRRNLANVLSSLLG